MMKKIIAVILGVCCMMCVKAQGQGGFYYKQGLEKAQAGDFDKALELLNKSIELKNDEYVAWYNRGIVKCMMGHYEDALVDLEQAIKLNPGYKKGYLNRGTTKQHLTDYEGAIKDFNLALQLDSSYAEAFYDRGCVYELFDKMDLACTDFVKAKQLGFEKADKRVSLCLEPSKRGEIHPILWLKQRSDNRRYGFAPDKPVKVGTGPDGGTANEHAYLDLLRDPKGNPVRYEKLSSCCGYASKNAPKGLAMCDKYQMSYFDETGELKIVYVYFSLYDYEEPLLLYGLNTVKEISSLH